MSSREIIFSNMPQGIEKIPGSVVSADNDGYF